MSQLGKMFKGQFCVVCKTKLELYKKETSLYPPGILQRRRHSFQLAWLYSDFPWISLFFLCFVTKRTVNIIKDSTVGTMHFQVSSLKRLCNDVKKIVNYFKFHEAWGLQAKCNVRLPCWHTAYFMLVRITWRSVLNLVFFDTVSHKYHVT